jgi:hypothetical protein
MKTLKQPFKMELLELLDETMAIKTLDLIINWLEQKRQELEERKKELGKAANELYFDYVDGYIKVELLEDLKQ